MTRDLTSPADIPLARPMRLDRLSRDGETPVEIAPDAGEASALATFLGVSAVRDMRFEGRLAPWGSDGWALTGRVTAEIEQPCVVTLEPVVAALAAEIDRRYLPAGQAVTAMPGDGAENAEDGPDPVSDTLDPAEAVVETLALAIDPYPRREGVEFGARVHGPPGEAPLTDEAARPFAGLASLKSRLGGDA